MSLFKHWLKSVKYEWHHTKNLCCQTNSVYDVQFWKWCWIIHNCDTSFEFYKKVKCMIIMWMQPLMIVMWLHN
jgi:hypothetical protein